MSKVTKPIATDDTLQSVATKLQTVAEKLSVIATDETLQGIAKDTTLTEVAEALGAIKETLKNAGKDETLQQIAKDTTLQNAVSALQSVVETLQKVATDETLQGVAKDTTLQGLAKDATLQSVAKDTTLKTLASDTSLQAVVKTISDKDAILLRMAEALDAKDTTQDRLGEINATAEEKKQEVINVGEQVKATIPDDYSVMSEKVNNASNALIGTASGEAVAITDVSSIEHTMGVKVKSKNVATELIYKDVAYQADSINYGSVVSGKISLEANKTYTVSFDTENTGATLRFVTWQRPYKIIGGKQDAVANGSRISLIIATTSGFYGGPATTLMQMTNITEAASSGLCSNFMIEEGEVATPYTPYVPDVSAVSVKRYGANLFDKNNYNVGYRVKNTDGTLSQSSIGYSSTDYIPVVGGKTYIVSGYITDDSTTRHIAYYDSNKVFVSGGNATDKFITPENAAYVRKTLHEDDVATYQIELGSTATEYEPYKEPTTHIPNADGTVEGVTPLYPTTTLLTDTEGVIVDAEYNRDINKAFAELEERFTNAIISLGGNV